VPAVSFESVAGSQPDDDAMPDSGSEMVQPTVTALVYQSLAPAVPARAGAIDGGVVSGSSSCIAGGADGAARKSQRTVTRTTRTERCLVKAPPLARACRCTTHSPGRIAPTRASPPISAADLARGRSPEPTRERRRSADGTTAIPQVLQGPRR